MTTSRELKEDVKMWRHASYPITTIVERLAELFERIEQLEAAINKQSKPMGYPYVSEHGHCLITQHTGDRPILTVEKHCKWYTLQLLHPDGRVEPVLYDDEDSLNHVPFPAPVIKLAEQNRWDLDWEALEMIVGRWLLELLDLDPSELAEPADFAWPPRPKEIL